MTNTTKAQKTPVQMGHLTLEGIMLPDGSFGVTVQQTTALFGLVKSNATKDLKRLLGKGSNLSQIKIEDSANNQNERYLTLFQFEKVVAKLDRKGNVDAQNFRDDLAGVMLTKLFYKAFNLKFDDVDEQDNLKARQDGKIARRGLTDAIKEYVERHSELSDNYGRFIYSNCSDCLNKIILGAKAKQAREFYELPKNSLLRNHIPKAALRELEMTEELATRLIDSRDIEPLEAVKQASTIMFTKFVGLDSE